MVKQRAVTSAIFAIATSLLFTYMIFGPKAGPPTLEFWMAAAFTLFVSAVMWIGTFVDWSDWRLPRRQ